MRIFKVQDMDEKHEIDKSVALTGEFPSNSCKSSSIKRENKKMIQNFDQNLIQTSRSAKSPRTFRSKKQISTSQKSIKSQDDGENYYE